MQKNEESASLENNALKLFIKENSYLIYEYINTEVLKDIAQMHPEYFIKAIKDLFINNTEITSNQNLLPYFLFTQIGAKGKLDYTSLRNDTINLSQVNKEASSYYNYVKFSLNKDFLFLDLMQNKTGGMAIKQDLVKFRKEIIINKTGLEKFITLYTKVTTSNKHFKKIEDEINLI